MKKNYERYQNVDADDYENPTLVSRLIGKAGDNLITGILNSITNKNVLELGCGTGRFTKLYCKNNNVTCVDINTHLFKLNNVKLIEGDVTKLETLLKDDTFETVLSFWMTEYLNNDDFKKTLIGCKKYLSQNGKIIFTVISKGLWGRCYVAGAKLKGINKYNYSNSQLTEIAQYSDLEIEKTISVKRFGFEFGKIIIFQNV
ncbi:MAG: class I SAM-dependent methyltransferase [Bacteroidetes bacterium]|nr:class I SAM-dependent methyltransferase [Bacteroidota bacterium]